MLEIVKSFNEPSSTDSIGFYIKEVFNKEKESKRIIRYTDSPIELICKDKRGFILTRSQTATWRSVNRIDVLHWNISLLTFE